MCVCVCACVCGGVYVCVCVHVCVCVRVKLDEWAVVVCVLDGCLCVAMFVSEETRSPLSSSPDS